MWATLPEKSVDNCPPVHTSSYLGANADLPPSAGLPSPPLLPLAFTPLPSCPIQRKLWKTLGENKVILCELKRSAIPKNCPVPVNLNDLHVKNRLADRGPLSVKMYNIFLTRIHDSFFLVETTCWPSFTKKRHGYQRALDWTRRPHLGTKCRGDRRVRVRKS